MGRTLLCILLLDIPDQFATDGSRLLIQRMHVREPAEILVAERDGVVDRLRKREHRLGLARGQVVRRERLVLWFLGASGTDRIAGRVVMGVGVRGRCRVVVGGCGRSDAAAFLEGSFDGEAEFFIFIVDAAGRRFVRALEDPSRLRRRGCVPGPTIVLGFGEGQRDGALQVGIVVCAAGPERSFGGDGRSVGVILAEDAGAVVRGGGGGELGLGALGPAALAYPDLLNDSQIGQRHHLAAARLVKHEPAVAAVVFPIRKRKRRPAAHARVGVNPRGRRGGRQQVGRDIRRRRGELDPLVLELAIHVGQVPKLGLGFKRDRPRLEQLDGHVPDLGHRRIGLDQADARLAPFPARDFPEEMIPAILDAQIRQAERAHLHARVLARDPGLEREHGRARGHGLAPDEVAYLELERNVLGFRVGQVERGTCFLCARERSDPLVRAPRRVKTTAD